MEERAQETLSECSAKVHAANRSKMEAEHILRTYESDYLRRAEKFRLTEEETVAKLRTTRSELIVISILKSQSSSKGEWQR